MFALMEYTSKGNNPPDRTIIQVVFDVGLICYVLSRSPYHKGLRNLRLHAFKILRLLLSVTAINRIENFHLSRGYNRKHG